jgi:hypothetical protein
MGQHIKLKASDGVEIGAWRAEPVDAPRGAIVVLQEIMGVNHHIRAVADLYAAQGYLAIAPALFDRVEPDVEVGYDGPSIQRGMAIVGKTDRDKTLLDIAAAIELAKTAGKVGVVGYCWGGTMAYLPLATIGYRRGVLLLWRRRARGEGRFAPRPHDYAFWRTRCSHPARRREGIRGGPSRTARIHLRSRSWLQLRRARQLRCAKPALARARTFDFFKQKIG